MNSAFFGNSSTGGSGGGIAIGVGSATVTNCTFSGNTAAVDGGAIMNSIGDGPFTVNPPGGGSETIQNGLGSLDLTNCTLDGNVAKAGDGGAIANFSATECALKNSILYNNTGGEVLNGQSIRNKNGVLYNSVAGAANCTLRADLPVSPESLTAAATSRSRRFLKRLRTMAAQPKRCPCRQDHHASEREARRERPQTISAALCVRFRRA